MSAGPDISRAPTPPLPPSAPASDAPAWPDRQLAILSELAEAGLEIALALKGRIVATAALDADPACPSASAAACASACADLTRAFDRASRAVRMSIALRERVLKEAASAAQSTPANSQEDRNRRAGRVRRIVGRIARGQHLSAPAREVLDDRARERLFDPDITGDLEGRPIGALVAQICADLGLMPRWHELSREAWAQAEIAERPPGSPYEAWPGLPPDPEDEDLWDADDDPDDGDEDEPPPTIGQRTDE